MLLIKEHLKNHLDELTKDANGDFHDLFELLTHPNKQFYKPLLIYVEKVINELWLEDERIIYSNLHFEGATENSTWILKEFISLKFFHLASRVEEDNEFLVEKVKEYERILNYRYRETPPYVSGVRSNKRTKKWLDAKRADENLLSFYRQMLVKYGSKMPITPKTIVNLTVHDFERFRNLFECRSMAISVHKTINKNGSLLLNFEKTFNEVDGIRLDNDQYLFDGIENILLLGSEGKSFSKSFSYRDLREWSGSGRLKRIFVVSFSSEYGFHKLKSRLERIQSTYHSVPQYPTYKAYPILKDEIDHLLDEVKPNRSIVEFFGVNTSSFWDDFVRLVDLYEGLYELRSYKAMNVYSLATSDEINSIIIQGIFSNEDAFLISSDTRAALHDLSQEAINKIRLSLENVLVSIGQSGWREFLRKRITKNQLIIVADVAKKNSRLLTALRNSLQLAPGQEFKSWKDVDLIENKKEIIAIDYRDAGKFPYSIHPNLFELDHAQAEIRGYFIAFLFKLKFDWCQYRYSSDLLKILTNPVRVKTFDIISVANKIGRQKPSVSEQTNWLVEQQYHSERHGSVAKLTFSQNKVRSFPSSELFIIKVEEHDIFSVVRAADLNDIDHEDNLYAQPLDDIHMGFNIYDKIVNKEREARELQIIKAKYSLSETDKSESLWKILLKKRLADKDVETFYNEVQSSLRVKGVELVGRSTFEHQWINVNSATLIPRERKLFMYLCEYLGLPDVYFFIMRRLKNAEVQNNRRNSQQMNALLSDLFNEGCFTDDKHSRLKSLNQIKQQLLENHDLEEIGFYQDTLVDDLNALVELLRPHIKLQKLIKIELN